MIRVSSESLFNFHPRCKKLSLNPLAFADDLVRYSKGDLHSATLLWQVLNTFAAASGLCANPFKSTLYLPTALKAKIAQELLLLLVPCRLKT